MINPVFEKIRSTRVSYSVYRDYEGATVNSKHLATDCRSVQFALVEFKTSQMMKSSAAAISSPPKPIDCTHGTRGA